MTHGTEQLGEAVVRSRVPPGVVPSLQRPSQLFFSNSFNLLPLSILNMMRPTTNK